MNILLICSGGMSTSALAKNMVNAAKKLDIDVTVSAVGQMDAKDHIQHADVILLSPQVRYLEAKIKQLVNNRIPVSVIHMASFGRLDGVRILADTLTILR